jgi:hypothetical protein
MRPDKEIVSWEGETKMLGEGLTLVRCGGHFEAARSCIGRVELTDEVRC